MVLKIRERKTLPKKVLIYGLDGSGKSTFAETYCKENNLSPICVDIDDTNFTAVPCIEFERSNHIKTKDQIINFIHDVKNSNEYDTIIIDGISSLLNLLVSNAKHQNKYGDRTNALNKILNELVKSKKNFIFVGQIDLETLDEGSSVAVVNINSIVNEKYKCSFDGKKYTQEVKKFRRLEEVEAKSKKQTLPKAAKVEEPTGLKDEDIETAEESFVFESAKEIAASIIEEIPKRDITTAKLEVMKLLKAKVISKEECPEIVKELEALLC